MVWIFCKGLISKQKQECCGNHSWRLIRLVPVTILRSCLKVLPKRMRAVLDDNACPNSSPRSLVHRSVGYMWRTIGLRRLGFGLGDHYSSQIGLVKDMKSRVFFGGGLIKEQQETRWSSHNYKTFKVTVKWNTENLTEHMLITWLLVMVIQCLIFSSAKPMCPCIKAKVIKMSMSINHNMRPWTSLPSCQVWIMA